MRSFDGWRWQFAIIIDSRMNLGPWLWGAENAGTPKPTKARYCDAGLRLLGALATERYLAALGSAAILRHATGRSTPL